MVKTLTKWFLRRLLRVPGARAYLLAQADPTLRFAPPGHFYSPLPDLAQVEKNAATLYDPPTAADGVQLRLAEQLLLLQAFAAYVPAFDWSEHAVPSKRYYLQNSFFEHGDATVLYAMLRHFRPQRVIEVGSGFSSALMLDTNERPDTHTMQLLFIEPYPERLELLLKAGDRSAARLLTMPVQDVPLAEFEALAPNDILFIDSAHVAKVGSDVNHLFFKVLPRLQPGVLIHIHDIFYPFEYPLVWLREGRAWNELYLLRAFLQYNTAFEVLFFNSYLAQQAPQQVRDHLPLMDVNPGGSLWLRKTA